MQLRLPPEIIPLAGNGSLTLESGTLAGRTYGLVLDVCPNPFCNCTTVKLQCTPEKPTDSGVLVDPICLVMDVEKRKFSRFDPEKRDSADELGQALVRETAPFHWELLSERFLKVKRQVADQEDFTGFTPQISQETLLHPELMVAYHDIIPFAGRLEVILDGQLWALDEQYCLRDRCECHSCALAFIRIDQPAAGRRTKRVMLNGRYNYSTGVFTGESPAPRQKRLLNMLCLALRAKYPDLNSILAHRQDRLLRLLESVRAKTPARIQDTPAPVPIFAASVPTPMFDSVTVPQASSSKPGRNDPCPCGSGKKYKKCCGR